MIEKIEHRDRWREPVAEVRVCSVHDVKPGTATRFDVDGHRLCVVRIGDDFYVIGDTCSHADYSLSRATSGRTSARSSARSTARRSRSSTGEPQTLPATRPVPVYAVRVDGDDVIVTP